VQVGSTESFIVVTDPEGGQFRKTGNHGKGLQKSTSISKQLIDDIYGYYFHVK
jgi:hypothetical protein